MRRTFLAANLFAAMLIIISCGGSGDKKEKASSAKVSPEMQDFMNNLNGRSASVGIALEQFGKPDLDDKDMDLYDLADPKVLEINGNCYLLQCKSGLTKRKYNICWEGGKISSIEDKGME